MKKLVWLLSVFALLSGACQSQKSSFVTVQDAQFKIAGRPYYFMGTNLWYGCMLGAELKPGDRARLIRELDHLQAIGITNLRVLGASEGLGLYYQLKPAIQPEPGQYDERLLQGLDFLLAEMGKRGMYAVVFLNNYWEWSGGMAQYLCWLTGEDYPNPNLPQFGWSTFMRFSAQFYDHQKANDLFRQYLAKLINRKNTFNGLRYRDDPTIMSWQLANEPRPMPTEDRENNFAIVNRWVDETAGYIRSLDPSHLISTGNEGLAGCLWSEECYLQMHQSKNIDYMTMHLWILNWSWYDPLKPEETYPEAERKALDYLQQHIAFAERLGKPITFEEFGIPRDGHQYSPEAGTTFRDKYYTVLFEAMYQSASQGSPMAGSNFWTWGGEGIAAHPEDYMWREGDDYTGDPPQEPQGRNSVFNSDESTLEIIKSYAQKMNALSK